MSSAQVKKQPDGSLINFSGAIDENLAFPEINENQKVILDLQQVTYINSIGIKLWIEWITPIAAKVQQIDFINCPKSIVQQMNMVRNFLPLNGKVKSLFVPFYCEECDSQKSVLVDTEDGLKINGEDVTLEMKPSAAMACGKEECAAELDVVPRKYFNFLVSKVK